MLIFSAFSESPPSVDVSDLESLNIPDFDSVEIIADENVPPPHHLVPVGPPERDMYTCTDRQCGFIAIVACVSIFAGMLATAIWAYKHLHE